MSIAAYKPRLVLRVLWHADFADGAEYARHLYSRFCRDSERPVSRGLGIPVYFHSARTPDEAFLPGSLDLNAAEGTVVIALVDTSVRANQDWITALRSLDSEIANSGRRHLLLPIACEDGVISVLTKTNFIRVDKTPMAERAEKISSSVTHELARLLLAKSMDVPTEDFGVLEKSYAPVKLFISHSKHGPDGNVIAVELRDYGRQHLPIATFYDSNDIAAGHDFEEEIKANVAESAMIVVHSNTYSDRSWCRREVLLAKHHGCPVLVVNAVTQGEDRLFPYLGNAPSVRWPATSPQRCQIVIDAALREVLRNAHFLAHVKTLKKAGVLPDTCVEIGTAPETLTYLNLLRAKKCDRTQPSVVLYPDPPLGDEEIAVLEDLNPSNISFTTPTASGVQHDPAKTDPALKGRVIAISISDSPNLPAGMSSSHLQDAMVECARHLLAQGGSLAYGGDLRPGGFTTILFDLVRSHNRAGSAERVHNFLSWPIHLRLDAAVWKEYLDEATFHKISPPADLHLEETAFIAPDTPQGRYVWARSLTVMRKGMTDKIHARILIGGQVTGFKGQYPGLLEEAVLALRSARPIYLVGGFGGCTRLIIEALKGATPDEFTVPFQASRDSQFDELVAQYRKASEDGNAEPLDYEAQLITLREAGPTGLNNGLSPEENEVLFETKNLAQIVYLILKGLTKTP